MYLVKTPSFIQHLFPNFIWRMPTDEKVLYLTFDDGPIPDVTPWILDQLDQWNAKATFFVVGDNVHKHPEIYEQIIEANHQIGSHTYHHLNGWQTDNISYFHNVRHCAQLVKSELFRPPYGKLKPRQAQFLQRHYQIVMWDVLSGDFDLSISKEKCYQNVIRTARPGSIVVFHDSLKAAEKMQYALPKVLKYYAEQGYRFETIDSQLLENKWTTRRSA